VYGWPAIGMAACVAAVLLATGTVVALDGLHHKGQVAASAATVGPAATQAPLSSKSHRMTASRSRRGHRHIPLTITVSPSPPRPPPKRPSPAVARSASPSPSRSAAPSPSPSSGSLAVSPGAVTLSQALPGGPYAGSFTLTAHGGPVTAYSIQDPAPAGDLSISPSGGSLTAGQEVLVTVTVNSAAGLAYETGLVVSPGQLTVAVFYPPAGLGSS
jgi:hypothetical protein